MNSDFIVAVHALVYLKHKKAKISSEELAKNVCTNSARIRKVMSKLNKAELISTKEGTEGGYLYNENLEDISLLTVSQALSTKFVDVKWRSGNHSLECLISSGMADIFDDIVLSLDNVCKEKLSQLSIANIEKKIFKENENGI